MKIEIYDVYEWTDDDNEQSYMFSRCDRSDVYEILADEEREKRESNTWWKVHVGDGKTIVREFDDEDEIVEWFNDNYCNGDMLIAEELEYEVIEENDDEKEEDEEE